MEEFKREINGTIRRKLIEAKHQPGVIKQWYNRVIVLDRNWRESKRKEERLREQGASTPRTNGEAPRLPLPWPQVWPRRQEVQ